MFRSLKGVMRKEEGGSRVSGTMRRVFIGMTGATLVEKSRGKIASSSHTLERTDMIDGKGEGGVMRSPPTPLHEQKMREAGPM